MKGVLSAARSSCTVAIVRSRELFCWGGGGGSKQDRGAIEALILSAISGH